MENLKGFLYNWDDKKPGEKHFTGNIMSYSYQDENIRLTKYSHDKWTGLIGIDTKENIANSSGHSQIKMNSQTVKKTITGIFADVWCLLTGGQVISGAENGCYYGASSWGNAVTNLIKSFFNSEGNDGGIPDYGNDAAAPTGIWYGPAPYNGPPPAINGGAATPANQPYEGGPIWIGHWNDNPDSDNCTTTDEHGNVIRTQDGCDSGYWENIQITDGYALYDSNNVEEVNFDNEGADNVADEGPYFLDNRDFQEYQPANGWPTVTSVISDNQFVGWDGISMFCISKTTDRKA